jgi:hypothetical protein
MTTYLFTYHAPSRPADATPADPAEMKAVMDQWMAWADRVGEGMVDLGTPLAGGVQVSPEGTAPSTREVVGYTLIEAADMDAALALAEGHPHLTMPGGGCTIEVHESQPIPGR